MTGLHGSTEGRPDGCWAGKPILGDLNAEINLSCGLSIAHRFFSHGRCEFVERLIRAVDDYGFAFEES